MKKLIVANWKMNLGFRESFTLAAAYKKTFKRYSLDSARDKNNEVVVCPSFFALSEVADVLESSEIFWGAQDVSWELKGAYTGEVSAVSLQELGCRYVIIGHSERRQYQGESCRQVNLKARALLDIGLTPIICVGESWEKRQAGTSEAFVSGQVKRALAGLKLKPMQDLVIAYEPIWAIGTGKAIKPRDAELMHAVVRKTVLKILGSETRLRVIYGGSVDERNAPELLGLPDIDGLLVGGASLKPDLFYKIAKVE